MKIKPFYGKQSAAQQRFTVKIKKKTWDYSFKNKDLLIFISSSSIESALNVKLNFYFDRLP